MKKKIITIFTLLITLFLVGCNTSNDNKENQSINEVGENIVLKEDLDFSKDIIVNSVVEADYYILPPKDVKELDSWSKEIISGEAISLELIIDPDGYTYTIVTFRVNEVLKGDKVGNEVSVFFEGGYISGEKYIEVHPIFKVSVEKFPESEEQNKKELKNKILRLSERQGEDIPAVGESYLLYLDEHTITPDTVEYEHLAGYEFAQGMFKIEDGKVHEFKPDLKEKAYKEAKEKGKDYKETNKDLENVGELISIEELVSQGK